MTKKEKAEAKVQFVKYGAIVEKLLDEAAAEADKRNAEEEAKAKAAGTKTSCIHSGNVSVSPDDKNYVAVCLWFNAALRTGNIVGNDRLVESQDGKSMHYEFRGGAVVGNYQPTLIVEHTTAKYLSITLF